MRITNAQQLAVGLSALASITLADGEIYVTYEETPRRPDRQWNQANDIREIQRSNRGSRLTPIPKEGLPRRQTA